MDYAADAEYRPAVKVNVGGGGAATLHFSLFPLHFITLIPICDECFCMYS